MNIVNIVDNLKMVNFGIWNAAISTAKALQKQGFTSYLVFPAINETIEKLALTDCSLIPLEKLDFKIFLNYLTEKQLTPENTVICTHGLWQFPTKFGYKLHKLGYKWVYTPHGMLEPWAMEQKKWRKKIYFKLFELRQSIDAELVRAVSKPEDDHLRALYPEVLCIPNGFSPDTEIEISENKPIKKVLFMGRLHKKKGIAQLINSWQLSSLYNNSDFELLIVGPDDGELATVKQILSNENQKGNIHYLGAMYGEEKTKLLSESTFFILPSFSEGFPTSVVEAMNYGLIPVISGGCNFPEVFSHGLGYKAEPDESMAGVLNQLAKISPEKLQKMAENNQRFVRKNYSLEAIAKIQGEVYRSLLRKEKEHEEFEAED
jgi:glycosyltransferase involved in cell wall biosynthesis